MKTIRIDEAFEYCGVNKDVIIHYLQEEWIHPSNQLSLELDEEDLARIQLIRELREDYGVNDEGIPIIPHLLDQLYRLHLELNKVEDT